MLVVLPTLILAFAPLPSHLGGPFSPSHRARRPVHPVATVPGASDASTQTTPESSTDVVADASTVVVASPTPPAAAATSLPPDSFRLLIDQVAESVEACISDGNLLLEVEFPPVPLSKLEDVSISAYDLLGANLQFTLEMIKRLNPNAATGAPRRVAITLPDASERRRARDYFGADEPWTGARLWSLNGGGEVQDDGVMGGAMALFGTMFKQGSGEVRPCEGTELYVILGASCQELPAVQRLHELEPGVPIVCFNLKLDVLRGDLGLPAFPPKAVHHEFLCKLKAAYLMRARSYSLSLSVPPFLLAYNGVLFRRYPEGFQTLLDKGGAGSSFRRVNVEEVRPALGNFKAQLTTALKLADDGAAQSAISSAGFKQSTWWEDDVDNRDVSKAWRL